MKSLLRGLQTGKPRSDFDRDVRSSALLLVLFSVIILIHSSFSSVNHSHLSINPSHLFVNPSHRSINPSHLSITLIYQSFSSINTFHLSIIVRYQSLSSTSHSHLVRGLLPSTSVEEHVLVPVQPRNLPSDSQRCCVPNTETIAKI